MADRLIFRLHWLLGLTAGSVLAIMGVTGASIAFKDELIVALNPGVVTLVPSGPALSAPALAACAKGGGHLTSLTMFSDPQRAARAAFGDDVRYFDPATCADLGPAHLESTLKQLEDVHRRLAAGEAGKAVTGASAIALVLLALSGLQRRWPRGNARDWRAWLTLSPGRGERARWLEWHKLLGTLALAVLLHSAATGLFFAYDWYRDGVFRLAGVDPPKPRGPRAPPAAGARPALDLDRAWSAFGMEVAQWRSATLRLPEHPQQPLQVLYFEPDAPHEKAISRIEIDPASGAVRKHERYSQKSGGARFVASMYPRHSGSYYGVGGRIAVALSSLSLAFFAVTGWMMFRARRSAIAARMAGAPGVT